MSIDAITGREKINTHWSMAGYNAVSIHIVLVLRCFCIIVHFWKIKRKFFVHFRTCKYFIAQSEKGLKKCYVRSLQCFRPLCTAVPSFLLADYMRKQSSNSGVSGTGNYPPRSGYDELDTTLMPPRPGEPYNRGSPGPSATGSMSGSTGPPPQPFPVAPGQGGKTILLLFYMLQLYCFCSCYGRIHISRRRSFGLKYDSDFTLKL